MQNKKERVTLEICPICNSDNVAKAYSITLRLVCFIILLFIIPYGIFICWIPLVLPYRHICQICGTELKPEQILKMDWREKRELVKEYDALEMKLAPFFGKWIKDTAENIYKITKAKGLLLLVKINDKNDIILYRVIAYTGEQPIPELSVSTKISSKFRFVIQRVSSTGEEDKDYILTELGKELLTEDEFQQLIDKNTDIKSWLNKMSEGQPVWKVDIMPEEDLAEANGANKQKISYPRI